MATHLDLDISTFNGAKNAEADLTVNLNGPDSAAFAEAARAAFEPELAAALAEVRQAAASTPEAREVDRLRAALTDAGRQVAEAAADVEAASGDVEAAAFGGDLA